MMEKITIELYSKNDNYKEIIGFYKFFLKYLKMQKNVVHLKYKVVHFLVFRKF